MLEIKYTDINIQTQCDLLWISRSSLYYTSIVSEHTKVLLNKVDEIYTAHPFYGKRRIRYILQRDHNIIVWLYKVRSVMQVLGIQAIYPKPNLSEPNPAHKKYPYLLRWVIPTHKNHIWSTDITYIRMEQWRVYLIAVIDRYSRFVLSWEVSTTMEVDFCVRALCKALEAYGKPEIFNSDQWSQFTSDIFTWTLEKESILISMDGRWRALDNIFVERLWRSVKYEEVYLHNYATVAEAKEWIWTYLEFYNHDRPHQSLEYKTPAWLYMYQ